MRKAFLAGAGLMLPLAMGAPVAEFISDNMPTPSCHASTLVEVKPGELLAAWFGGTAEGAKDVAIWGARRRGGAWERPRELVREPEIATYNPVLFYSRDGVLWLYYKFGPHPTSWTAGRTQSRDHGLSWSPIEHLPAGLLGPIRAKPLVLPDGLIVSGTSVESYRSWACWIERSTDHGRSWTKHGPITVPRSGGEAADRATAPSGVEGPFSWRTTHGIIQPVIVPMGGKRLRLFARATGNIGRVCVADSADLGISWTPARPIELPNPNSGIDVVKLRDGRLVMIYNHTNAGRSPLNLAVSGDGERWKRFADLETEPGEFSYPAMIEGGDGNLHITYTWNRKKIKYLSYPVADVPRP